MDFEKTQPVRLEPLQLRFNGSGGEYFRIWIVNLLLSIVTLGIYSAWAKVRRLQYFYRNTELAGSSFEYHGSPLSILKGRIVAIGLLLIYQNGFKVSPAVGVLSLLLLGAVLPVLLRNSLRFRLHNSSYRGLRFRFKGTVAGAYETFLFGYLGSLFTGFLLAPLFHQRLKVYQHGNSWFGQTRFSFAARIGQFYGIYGRAVLLSLGALAAGIVLMVALSAALGGLMPHAAGAKPDLKRIMPFIIGGTLLMYLSLLLVVAPYVNARLQNLIWNNTRLGEHRFEYRLSARRLFWIYLSNLLGVVLSLGFFAPWAMVRLARYRSECLTLVPAGSLDEFVADQSQEVGAIGEEAAGAFDIDISF
ncbi:MAG: DUF898 domain-containing protein [Nevskia sp.]|nr:DUF898 domain-containing protein [Nevskia sp.]